MSQWGPAVLMPRGLLPVPYWWRSIPGRDTLLLLVLATILASDAITGASTRVSSSPWGEEDPLHRDGSQGMGFTPIPGIGDPPSPPP